MSFVVPRERILNYFKGKRIAVLAGGRSDEREISLRSGNNVFSALKEFPELAPIFIDVDRGIAKTLSDEKIDYVYNALHGTFGEDGAIQGALETLNIGYTGENVFVSALCMHKVKTKELWAYHGVRTPAFAPLSSLSQTRADGARFGKTKLKYPFILKPIANGSSFGVRIISDRIAFKHALKTITSDDYFAEAYIKGEEATVAVMRTKKDLYTFPILGIKPQNEFYDFDAKYTKGRTAFEIPANVPSETTEAVLALVKKGYAALECEGLCRIDVMLDSERTPYLIENNTQPGMTDTSDVPLMAEAAGVSFKDLVLFTLGYKFLMSDPSYDG